MLTLGCKYGAIKGGQGAAGNDIWLRSLGGNKHTCEKHTGTPHKEVLLWLDALPVMSPSERGKWPFWVLQPSSQRAATTRLYVCVRACVCVCVWEREREREKEHWEVPSLGFSDWGRAKDTTQPHRQTEIQRHTLSLSLSLYLSHTHTHTHTHTGRNSNGKRKTEKLPEHLHGRQRLRSTVVQLWLGAHCNEWLSEYKK